jgi:hypothetical protein
MGRLGIFARKSFLISFLAENREVAFPLWTLQRGGHLRLRGGSWNNNPGNCRSAHRNRNEPGNRNNNLGFRVVCSSAFTLLYQNCQV